MKPPTIYLLFSFFWIFSTSSTIGQEEHAGHHSHELENQISTWPAEALAKLKTDNLKRIDGVDLVTRCIPFDTFNDLQKDIKDPLLKYANAIQSLPTIERVITPHLCWHEDTAAETVDLFEDIRSMAVSEAQQDPDVPQEVFQGRNRWTRTATNPSGNTQGTPVTITWSIVPDGTDAPGRNNTRSPSALRANLNAAFGSAPNGGDPVRDAPWFSMFQEAFDEWSDITGNVYLYEANDDRARMDSRSGGILGIRADIRIAANDFGDGPSNVLAFNSFPNNGDMVIDSAGFGPNGPLRNSLTFINVIAHEHGHGLGMSHVCPRNRTKLMEPSVTRNFRGPQLDDIITVQELYGDPLERQTNTRNNDTVTSARNLGTLNSGFAATRVSISDSNDVDYYRFRLSGPRSMSVSLTPENAEPFREGPQTQDCNSVTAFPLYDPQTRQNLGIRILGPDGNTVLANSNSGGLGDNETLNNIQLTQTGVDYYIEITGGGENSGSANNAQLYNFTLSLTDPSAIQLSDFTILQENCSPANGVADPDETVTAAVTVANIGVSTANNITVSLSGSSDLTVNGPSSENIGSLNPGESTAVMFTFSLAGDCLDSETIVLRAQTATGFVESPQDLTLGTLGNVLSENFDDSTALPQGFTQSVTSPSANWRVTTSGASSAPNTAFSSGTPATGGGFLNPTSALLNTPIFSEITAESELQFDHNYSLIASNVTGASDRVNGGVLEISINNEVWEDWISSGGEFLQNPYNNPSILNFSGGVVSPISNRAAWSGNSNGFVTTLAKFPDAAIGQNVRVRWHLATMRSNTNNGGWRIDNIILRGPVCCEGVTIIPSLDIAAADAEASEFDVTNTANFTISSNIPAPSDLSINYTLSGTATSGSDFTSLNGSTLLTSGANSIDIPVTAITDSQIEGDENLTLTLSTSSAYQIGTSSASITIKDLPFDEYRRTNFGAATQNTGPNDDFDNDGNDNLLEYAFGLNPTENDTLPFSLFLDSQSAGNSMLDLNYTEDTRLLDIDYIPETSTTLDPNSWSTNSVTITRGSTTNGVQDVKASVPVEPGTTPRFLRIRVERQ